MFNFDGYCLPRLKKTNTAAKHLMEDAIKEINKDLRESGIIVIRQCAHWRGDGYDFEYKELSSAFQILKRYLMIKGCPDVKYTEDIDRLREIVHLYLRFYINRKSIESFQRLLYDNETSRLLFKVGDKAYLLCEQSHVLVTITDVFKHDGKWYYSIDMSNYMEGLKVIGIKEETLSKTPFATVRNEPMSSRTFDRIVSQFRKEYIKSNK